MIRNAVLAAALALSCGGDKDPSGAPPKQAAGDAPAPKPAAPAITKNTLEDAKKRAAPLRPWAESYAAVVELVGKPKRVEGDAHHWYVLDNELCWELRLLRNGEKVASARIKAYPKAVPTSYARCDQAP